MRKRSREKERRGEKKNKGEGERRRGRRVRRKRRKGKKGMKQSRKTQREKRTVSSHYIVELEHPILSGGLLAAARLRYALIPRPPVPQPLLHLRDLLRPRP